MQVKLHDFITINFVGKVKDTGEIFDITKEDDAKKYNLHASNRTYKPLTICVGERHVVEGLDEFLVGKETGKEYNIDIPADKAFGKRDPKLLRLVPLSTFNEHKVRPEPGLHINLDGMIATVRSVSGGRVILDFNHPLAGKEVEYQINIGDIVSDTNEKLKALLNFLMPGLPHELKGNILHINVEFPEQIRTMLNEKIKKLIPEIINIEYKPAAKAEEKKDEKGKESVAEPSKKKESRPAAKSTKV